MATKYAKDDRVVQRAGHFSSEDFHQAPFAPGRQNPEV